MKSQLQQSTESHSRDEKLQAIRELIDLGFVSPVIRSIPSDGKRLPRREVRFIDATVPNGDFVDIEQLAEDWLDRFPAADFFTRMRRIIGSN